MIADQDDSPIERAVKMITAPIWVPIYFLGVGVWKLSVALQRRKPEQVQQVELLQPVARTEVERAVYAALILAGEPVNNRRLAELMRVSPGESSKRVAQLEGVIKKERLGRQVRLSLPTHH